MSDWHRTVLDCFDDTPEARAFILDVLAHLGAYRRLSEALERHPERKDTAEKVADIRDHAAALADLLDLAHLDAATLSWLKQGVLLSGTTDMHWSGVDVIAGKLRALAAGAAAMLAAVADDPAVKRRGANRHDARRMLVQDIRTAYDRRFNEPAEVSNLDFADILGGILDSVGIPHANLARLIAESKTPA